MSKVVAAGSDLEMPTPGNGFCEADCECGEGWQIKRIFPWTHVWTGCWKQC